LVSGSRGASSTISSPDDLWIATTPGSVTGPLGCDDLESDQIGVGAEVLYEFNEFGGE